MLTSTLSVGCTGSGGCDSCVLLCWMCRLWWMRVTAVSCFVFDVQVLVDVTAVSCCVGCAGSGGCE